MIRKRIKTKARGERALMKQQSARGGLYEKVVPGAGIEPARYRYRWILSPVRLPVPPSRQQGAAQAKR
jgi:hypothetical protein